MQQQTYTIEQLAVLFQRSSATMRGYIEQLQKEHRFPARLPCFDNLWSKPAVDRWFASNGQPDDFIVGSEKLDAARELLDSRYGRG
jgi:hypothetical protein